MPEATPSLKEDLAALVSGATAPPAAAPATPDTTTAAADTQPAPGASDEKPGDSKEGDKKDEAAPKPAEPPKLWSPELQKWTQKHSAKLDSLHKENEALKAQIARIAKQLGVEDEAAPAVETPETPTAPSSERESELSDLRQKQMLLELRIQHPTANPEKMLDESVLEAMGILGIPPDAEELPADVTAQAFQRVANGLFQKKVAALAAAPKAPEPVKKPQPPSKLPPKTPGGASIGTPPVSHQPSRRAAGGNTPSFAEDCAKLAGQTP